jgi:polyhydroxyalkanoate synthase
MHLTKNVKGLGAKEKAKLEFYTRQFLDAISPSNYLATNPEVLRATLETNAENLVKGLKRLAEDVAKGQITQTDYKAFEVGKNLATTPGKVVFQNDLMQLIQYSPSTKEVYQTPLLFIPAWINKYYIADLQPDNSFVKWLVDHGFTLFMISWVNPDKRHANKDFADYMNEGVLAALEQMKKLTGEAQSNVIGYCLGGTLLATTLAYLEAKNKKLVKAATFLTTLLDFKNAGDLGVFIDEAQINSLEKRMSEQGYLSGDEMAMTFSMLRSNDLIWSNVVNNYLLGKDPFPFDLLYWNSDSTRMPAKMHSFYLRNMYLNNNLAKKKIKIGGVDIDLTKITTPAYFLSTLKDHIAPWKATYEGAKMFKDAVFTLADSGHIAGVVNPPHKSKYPHWINGKPKESADEWLKHATEEGGSWWTNWQKWIKKFEGPKVAARKIGKAIEDAPGSYVKKRS